MLPVNGPEPLPISVPLPELPPWLVGSASWLKDFFAAAAALFFNQAATIAAAFFVANGLGSAGYGLLGWAQSYGRYAFRFCSGGDEPLLLRTLSQKPKKAGTAFLIFLALRLILAAAALLAAVPLLLYQADVHPEKSNSLLLLAVFDGLLLAFSVRPAFDVRRRMKLHAAAAAVRQIVYLAIITVLYFTLGFSMTPHEIVAAHIVCLGVETFWQWWWTWRHWGRFLPLPTPRDIWKVWKAARPAAWGASFAIFYLGLGPLLLKDLVDADVLGAFVMTDQLVMLTAGFLHLVTRAAAPEITHAVTAKNTSQTVVFGASLPPAKWSEFRDTAQPWFLRLLISGLVAVFSLSLGGGRLAVLLAGASFESVIPLTSLAAWRLLPEVLGVGCDTALIGCGRTNVLWRSHFLGCAAAVCGMCFGIPLWGAYGAVGALILGRTVSCVSSAFWLYFILQKK
jgi:O-antigen/teichoic acid export membrane protein